MDDRWSLCVVVGRLCWSFVVHRSLCSSFVVRWLSSAVRLHRCGCCRRHRHRHRRWLSSLFVMVTTVAVVGHCSCRLLWRILFFVVIVVTMVIVVIAGVVFGTNVAVVVVVVVVVVLTAAVAAAVMP